MFELLWSPRCSRCDPKPTLGRPVTDYGVRCCRHCHLRIAGHKVPEIIELCNLPKAGNLASIVPGATVIERRIAEVIAAAAPEHVALGDLSRSAGRRHRDWCLAYLRRELVERGQEKARFRICPDCGAVLYFAMGPAHLCPVPALEIPIYQSVGGGSLIIRSDVADLVRPLVKPPSELTPLLVICPSLDGLELPTPPDGVMAWDW
jgi:hypothetical protein